MFTGNQSLYAAVIVMLFAGTAHALTDNLQLYSSMNNYTPYSSPAYWVDASSNGHDAVTNPPAYNGGGNRGTAVDFTEGDGNLRMFVNDGLNTDFDPGVNDYSVSLWYYEVAADSNYSYLLAKGNTTHSYEPGFCLATVDGAPRIRMEDVQGTDDHITLYSNTGDISGSWHHLVTVFDRTGTVHGTPNQAILYIDDQYNGSVTLPDINAVPFDMVHTTKEFVLGGQEASTAYDFEGYLDDVAIYRGALSTSDIHTLYTASSLDASTIGTAGITPVTIHNFATNRNQGETFPSMADDFDGHLGSVKGDATQVIDPVRGKVLAVNDSTHSDYVTYGDVLDPMNQSYTAAFWFKLSDTGTGQMMVANGMNNSSGDDGWAALYSTDGHVYFRANHGDDDHKLAVRQTFSAEDFDEWHHMAVVIDQESGVIKAYLDGVGSGLSGTENGWELRYTGNSFTPGTNFESLDGDKYDDLTVLLGSSSVNGQVDDLAIWTRALTDTEILSLANGNSLFIPGDTNFDRIVNETDANMVASHWGQTIAGGVSVGDFNEDGVVDAKDASIMAAHWGDHNVSEGTAVPEPGVLVLTVMGLIMIAVGRRNTTRG